MIYVHNMCNILIYVVYVYIVYARYVMCSGAAAAEVNSLGLWVTRRNSTPPSRYQWLRHVVREFRTGKPPWKNFLKRNHRIVDNTKQMCRYIQARATRFTMSAVRYLGKLIKTIGWLRQFSDFCSVVVAGGCGWRFGLNGCQLLS